MSLAPTPEPSSAAVISGLPPGPKAHPVVQTYHWMRRPFSYLEECAARYGDMFTLRLVNFMPAVITSNQEAIREVFASTPEAMHAGKANIVLKPFLGEGSLLLLDGAEHQRQRRLLMPPFHGERMHAYGRTMLEIVDQSIDTWPLGRPFALHRPMQDITLQIILRTVFGMQGGRLEAVSRLLSQAADLLSSPALLLPWLQKDLGRLSPWGRFQHLNRQGDRLLFEEIRERKGQGGDGAGRTDILSLMLQARDEEGQPMTEAELRDQMVTLMTAGHETTATSLAWAFRWLLARPDEIDATLWQRLRDEVESARGADGTLDPERLGRLELLDGTVREALRLQPVVPLVGRVLQEPFRLLGYELPPGTMIAPCIYLAQRNPAVYPEPERFVPDRFRNLRPSPAEWLPFGGGVRRCIGAAFAQYEMKMVLAAILSRVTMLMPAGYTPAAVRRSITLTPKGGLPVILTSRRRQARRAAA